jgi:hypothetical protein
LLKLNPPPREIASEADKAFQFVVTVEVLVVARPTCERGAGAHAETDSPAFIGFFFFPFRFMVKHSLKFRYGDGETQRETANECTMFVFGHTGVCAIEN